MAEIGRLEIFAALVLLLGLVLCARGSWRLIRAIRARFTYGAPYRSGTIQDRLFGLLLEIPVLLLGAALAFLALAEAAFQPNESAVRVGQIEARRSGWAKVSVRLVPDPFYPADRVLEGEIGGARWAVAGDFITWEPGIKWLGLRDGHRVRSLIGTNDTTGTTPAGRVERTPLDPLPAAAARLFSVARHLRFVRVHTETSSWFPLADRQVMILYAIGPGYLAEVVSESAP
ncbi:MAG: hypothetical protein HYS34_00460 [Acidobacteria bacterium]|nr:hypothetical protein [Acidobacteriota bacterium]